MTATPSTSMRILFNFPDRARSCRRGGPDPEWRGDDPREFAGRHRGGTGFGRHGGPGWGGGPFGGDGPFGVGGGFGPGRKLGSADLQLLILRLLADQPRHGYELIKAIDERSKGYYAPSPGMIYPALSYLEELGHASVDPEGTKKLYTVTVAGLSFLDEHRERADALLQRLDRIGERVEQMRRAMAEGEAGDTPSMGARGGWGGPVGEALEALRAAMRSARDATPEDRQRIAAILQRAADEIARRDPPKGSDAAL